MLLLNFLKIKYIYCIIVHYLSNRIYGSPDQDIDY